VSDYKGYSDIHLEQNCNLNRKERHVERRLPQAVAIRACNCRP